MLTVAAIPGIDKVYANNIPHSEAADDSLTEVLITDNGSTADGFGNDDFHALTMSIEVQIWYAAKDGLDYEAIEAAILRAFTANNWQVSGWRRRIQDPDTKQLSNTAYIMKTKNV